MPRGLSRKSRPTEIVPDFLFLLFKKKLYFIDFFLEIAFPNAFSIFLLVLILVLERDDKMENSNDKYDK